MIANKGFYLTKKPARRVILYNDWSAYGRDEWHLIHIGRRWLNGWKYQIALFGFAIVIFKRRD